MNLIFDEKSERNIRDLWLALVSDGVPIVISERYRPHITIAAYKSPDPSQVSEAVATIADQTHLHKIELSPIGCFPETGVLYLAPRVSNWLLDLHSFSLDLISSEISADLISDYLVKDRWVPHVTLVKGINESVVSRSFSSVLFHWRMFSVIGNAMSVRVHPNLEDYSVHRFSSS